MCEKTLLKAPGPPQPASDEESEGKLNDSLSSFIHVLLVFGKMRIIRLYDTEEAAPVVIEQTKT